MNTNTTSSEWANFQNSIKSLSAMLAARVHLTNAIHAASANVVHAATVMAGANPVAPTSGLRPVTPGGNQPRLPVTASDSPTGQTQPVATSPTNPTSAPSTANPKKNPDEIDVIVGEWLKDVGEMNLNGIHYGVCQQNYQEAVREIIGEAVRIQQATHGNTDITNQLKSIEQKMISCSDQYAICCHAPLPFVQLPKL